MKRDCLLFSVNVKLFFEFFMMREKANYFCVKVFSGDIQGTLFLQMECYEKLLRDLEHSSIC